MTNSESKIIAEFNRIYHSAGMKTWMSATWMGFPIRKAPTDLFIYQEIIHRTRPDVVVETGTFKGGSALFIAQILDGNGSGQVITIDNTNHPERPTHPRISYMIGSSLDPSVIREVKSRCAGRVMVILDSDHMYDHVINECLAYCDLVTPGLYLIVEDTNIVTPDCQATLAVDQFLKRRPEFHPDENCERLMLTFNPRGYLLRGA